MKKVLSILLAVVLVFGMLPASALTVFAADEGTWTLVTDASTLAAGDQLVIACTAKGFVAGAISSSVMKNVSATFSDKTISALPTDAVVLTLGGSADSWTLSNAEGKMLGATAAKKVAWGSGTTTWGITITAAGDATIQNGTSSYGRFLYNVNSPRFTTYTSDTSSSMLLPQLYRLETAGGTTPDPEPGCEHANTVNTNVVEPGCDTVGTHDVYCNDCKTTIETGVETPATGHKYEDGVCTACGEKEPEGYVLKNIADIKEGDIVIITMAKGSDVYAMSNNNGTSNAPTASKVTVTNNTITEAADTILWNVGGSADAYIFYPNGTTATWLYCTSTNNGVRVGTNTANTFKIDAESGYLVHNGTSRYIGVYNSADWRCYTSVNANITGQTLAFYVQSAGDSSCEECVPGTPVKEKEIAPTCTKEGSYEEVTYCTVCSNVITRETVTVPMSDHVYENGACTSCGKVDPSVETKAELMTTLPGDGDKIIIYNPSSKTAMGIGDADSDSKLDSVSTEPVDTLLPYNTAVAVLTVEIDGDYFAFKLDDGTYLATDSDGGQLTFEATASDLTLWSIAAVDGLWTITSKTAENNYGAQAIEYYLGEYTTYASSGDAFNMALYLVEKGENACAHENTTEQSDGYAATCTEPGKTNSWTCNACGVTVTAQQDIPAQGHNYKDGVCTRCRAEEPQRYYIATTRTNGTAWYMTSDLGTASTKRYQAVATGILPSNIDPDEADSNYVFILTDNGDGTYYLQAEGVEGDNYLGWTSGNSGALVAKENAPMLTVDVTEEGRYNIHFTGDEERYLSLNSATGSDYFAWYKGTQSQDLVLIPVEEAEDMTATLYGDVENITVDGELYLDLNGHKATNVTANAIYACDSSASAAAAGTGSITTSSEVVMDNTVNNIRYIALEDNDTYTFHVLEMKLSAVTLRAKVVEENEQIIEENGIYYKATYVCDDTLKNAIDSYGVVFSLDNMPGADFKTEQGNRNLYTVYEGEEFVSGAEVTSGSIFGIMKEGLENNAERGKMKIYANAYIIINGVNNGEPLMADVTNAGTTWTEGYTGVAYSLFDVMDKLDEKWDTLGEAQKTTIQTFYGYWANKGMSAWAAELPNIAG